MALERQNMRFLFDAGVDQEINPEVLGEANMQAVANGVFRVRGRIEKRLPMAGSLDTSTINANGAGYQQEPTSTLLPTGDSLAIQGNATLRTFNASGERLELGVPQHSANIRRIDQFYDPFIFSQVDSTVINGFLVSVYMANELGILRVVEIATGQEIIGRQIILTQSDDIGAMMRVERAGNYAFIFAASQLGGTTPNVYDLFTWRTLNLTDPANLVLSSPVTLTTVLAQVSPVIEPFPYSFDTTHDDAGNCYVIYNQGLPNVDWVVSSFDNTGSATGTSATFAPSSQAGFGSPAIYAAHGIAAVFTITQPANVVGPPNTTVPVVVRFSRALVPLATTVTLPVPTAANGDDDGSGNWRVMSMVRAAAGTAPTIQVALDAFASEIHMMLLSNALTVATDNLFLWGRLVCKLHYEQSGKTGVPNDRYFPILAIQKDRNYASGTVDVVDDEELDAQPNILLVAFYRNQNLTSTPELPYLEIAPFGRFDVDDAATDHWSTSFSTPVAVLESEVNTAFVDQWHIPYLIRGAVTDQNPLPAPPRNPEFTIGGANVVVDYDLTALPLPRMELGDAAYTGGACVQTFSAGNYLKEAGFHFRPILWPSDLVLGVGTLTAGTYGYALVCERYAANGDLIRSQASRTVSVTVNGSQNVTVTYHLTPYVSSAGGGGGTASANPTATIKVYRTEVNGVNLLLRDERPVVMTNTLTEWPTDILIDNAADSTLKLPLIYPQAQNGRENDPPPAPYDVTEWRNRAVVVNGQDRDELWISNVKAVDPATNRLGLEFSATITTRIAAGGGDIEAVAALDEKLIIFKPDSIYMIAGEGPDAGGLGGTFSQPIERSSQTGCINKSSVISTEVGVFFQARGGIYLLDRGMQVDFVGHSVTSIVPGTSINDNVLVKRAVVVQELKEVKFLLDDANQTVLTYHYRFQRWSTATYFDIANRAADSFTIVDMAVYKGKLVMLVSDSTSVLTTVYTETDQAVYADGNTINPSGTDYDGTAYQLNLITPTFKFANLTGFQRVKNVRFLLNRLAACDVQILHSYDEDNTNTVQHTYTDADLTSTDTNAQVVRLKLGRQKTRTVRFQLRDVAPGLATPSLTSAFQAVQLSLEVGVKKGGFRIGAANKR